MRKIYMALGVVTAIVLMNVGAFAQAPAACPNDGYNWSECPVVVEVAAAPETAPTPPAKPGPTQNFNSGKSFGCQFVHWLDDAWYGGAAFEPPASTAYCLRLNGHLEPAPFQRADWQQPKGNEGSANGGGMAGDGGDRGDDADDGGDAGGDSGNDGGEAGGGGNSGGHGNSGDRSDAGRGNGSEGSPDSDPGNSGGNNNGGD